jgi:hypothetical protein
MWQALRCVLLPRAITSEQHQQEVQSKSMLNSTPVCSERDGCSWKAEREAILAWEGLDCVKGASHHMHGQIILAIGTFSSSAAVSGKTKGLRSTVAPCSA